MELTGKWHIIYSTFPLWTSGKRQNPTFRYGPLRNDIMTDTVEYYRKGRYRRIEGTDKVDGDGFIWRGKGIMSIAKSRWKIIHHDPAAGLVFIQFEKTLFTPEGYDVISRKPEPDAKSLEKFLQRIQTNIPGLKLIKIEYVMNLPIR